VWSTEKPALFLVGGIRCGPTLIIFLLKTNIFILFFSWNVRKQRPHPTHNNAKIGDTTAFLLGSCTCSGQMLNFQVINLRKK
jgi:hypothetical protein